ncbi:MAG: recombinase family protein [Nitrospirales bacterium]
MELRINEREAEVVPKIFRLYVEGQGFTSIAKALNAEGAICPRPRPSLRKPHGWVSSSVRQIILRPLYMGEQVWGRTKKRTTSGAKKSQRRPEHEWIVIPVPDLQIVSSELWKEVQDRWKNMRQLYLRATDGRLHGRPTNGHESPYLLTGFTECKTCKGSLFIRSRSHGKRRAFHYACTTHYQRGPETCAEWMLLPMELLNRAILETMEQDVLHPSILVKAVEKALQQPQSHDDEPDARREVLRKDLAQVEAELARLATALATGGPLSTLLSALHDREERRTQLHAELAALEGRPSTQFDPATVEHELR